MEACKNKASTANAGRKYSASGSDPRPLAKRQRADEPQTPVEFSRRRLQSHSNKKIESGKEFMSGNCLHVP